MTKKLLCFLSYFAFLAFAFDRCAGQSPDYQFDANGIARPVLENYLKHSITLTGLLEENSLVADGGFPDREDDYRFIKNIGAKFIGRSIYRWGRENVLNNPLFLEEAKRVVALLHKDDPDMVFQACLFEIVTTGVNEIDVPAWAFETLGLPVEERKFRYDDMLAENGKFVNHWGRRGGGGSSVPDISRTESQLWFLFLAGFYMDAGCEAFHLGQVNLIGMNDPGWKNWEKVIGHIRTLAKSKTRRGWIILDAHTPSGGMVVDGKSLLDFNSFPLRIKEVPDKPMEAVLEVGYLDGLYKRSEGCVTPSGWECESLPFLVEFDNFGVSRTPGRSTLESHFIWGYDEITWFSLQTEEYRNTWLKYAYNWLRENDPNGFLQMPAGRVITPGQGEPRGRYRGNNASETIPNGKNIEATIKELWK